MIFKKKGKFTNSEVDALKSLIRSLLQKDPSSRPTLQHVFDVISTFDNTTSCSDQRSPIVLEYSHKTSLIDHLTLENQELKKKLAKQEVEVLEMKRLLKKAKRSTKKFERENKTLKAELSSLKSK